MGAAVHKLKRVNIQLLVAVAMQMLFLALSALYVLFGVVSFSLSCMGLQSSLGHVPRGHGESFDSSRDISPFSRRFFDSVMLTPRSR